MSEFIGAFGCSDAPAVNTIGDALGATLADQDTGGRGKITLTIRMFRNMVGEAMKKKKGKTLSSLAYDGPEVEITV